MNAKFLPIALSVMIAVLSGCAVPHKEPARPIKMDDGSAVDSRTQYDAAELIWYSMQRVGCRQTDSIHPEILEKTPNFQAGKGYVITGEVKERWIAYGCNTKIPYIVGFKANKQNAGGSDITIRREFSGAPAIMLNTDGSRAYFQGNNDEALAKYEAARKAAKDAGDQEYEAIAMHNLARTYIRVCKPQEAARWYAESIKVRELLPDHPDASITQSLVEYARLLIATDQAKDAVAPMERAIPKLETSGIASSDPIEYANFFDDYAKALEAAGKNPEAARLRAEKLRQANPGRKARFIPEPYPAQCAKATP